jgi:uroporphyrinogen-III synthase
VNRSAAARERRPLAGCRVAVTRAAETGSSLADKLRALGADVIEAPVTSIEPLAAAPLENALANLERYDWLILTSQVAVRIFLDALDRTGRDRKIPARIRVAAIGPATERSLRDRGVVPDVVPNRFVAEGLVERLAAIENIGRATVLYATSQDSRDVLPDGLRELGARVDVVHTYRSVPAPAASAKLSPRIDAGEIDIVTLTSTSAVEGYVSAVGPDRARRVHAVTIGPVTSETARRHAIPILAEATESTIDGLVNAVVTAR